MSIEKRILVVENDPDFRRAIVRRLRTKGYVVFGAEDMASAQRLLTQEHIHLAIVDVRLEDDRMPEDSGIRLAAQIKPPVIPLILTGYPKDYQITKRAFTEGGAVDFVAKQDGPEALLKAIEQAFRQRIGICEGLRIECGEEGFTTLQIAEAVELTGIEPECYENEVKEVLLKLFSYAEAKKAANRIVVTSLLSPQQARVSSQSGAVLLKATPYFGDRRGATKVVKLAERCKIETEAQNYKEYVSRFIQTHCYANQEGSPQYTLRIGGIIYSLLGTDLDKVTAFSEFYEDHEPAEIMELLNALFTETCQLWYGKAEQKNQLNIPQLYEDALHLTRTKLENALKQAREKHPKLAPYRADLGVLNFPGMDRHFINPITWMDRSFYADTRLCITHGDMHSRNILVDDSGRGWLIDFARTGEGHILRDFIELESDIKFALLDETDIPTLCGFELALLSPNRLAETLHFGDLFDRDPLRKAFEVIRGLRKLASGFYPGADMREYYQALLYQTLNVMRLQHIGPLKKRHALLAAALTCERLQSWSDPWPPADLREFVERAEIIETIKERGPLSRSFIALFTAVTGVVLLTFAGVVLIIQGTSLTNYRLLLAMGVFITIMLFVIAFVDPKLRKWVLEKILDLYRTMRRV